MDESPDAHMETDVSSTTDDLDVQEVTGSHRNVETTVVVEKIYEEEMSPNKLHSSLKEGTSSTIEPGKCIDKSPPKEVPIKKIIIKSSSLQKPVQKSILTVQDLQKISLDVQSNKSNSLASQSPDAVDSSSKPELNSPKKLDGYEHKSPGKNTNIKPVSEYNKPLQVLTTPSKDSLLKITIGKDQLIKPSQTGEQTPIRESSNKITLVRKTPAKFLSKETVKVSPIKEPVKELPIKETAVIVGKETTLKIAQEAPSEIDKQTPSRIEIETLSEIDNETTSKMEKESQLKRDKESSSKIDTESPSKKDTESPSKIDKESPTKLYKESPTKLLQVSPIKPKNVTANKETTLEKSKPLEIINDTNTIKPDEVINKNVAAISALEVDKEASNDSLMETNSDTSEKEHNKSISRELKSLINSAKESKIISECTQLTSKTRKSRTPLESLNTSIDPEKIHGRRCSENSQKSNCSEKSEKTATKRSMRSQNPEFVSKVKSFLSSVTGKVQKDEDMSEDEIEEVKSNEEKTKVEKSRDTTESPMPKKKKLYEEQVTDKSSKLRSDAYCWQCHWAVEPQTNDKAQPPVHCTVCPRSFHFKCLPAQERTKMRSDKNWACPECLAVLAAESSETRSPAMKKTSLGMLCELLKHAMKRMMDLNGVEPFMHAVDRAQFPDYDKYVVHPMDLTLMKENISEGLYGSTEAFVADAQWILHNSIIFNTLQSKLTAGARALFRSCRAEMGEIEACPECYAAAHARRPTWFTDVCTTPHILLWAKLKGFPYWPAKGMSVNNSGLVDVRFFGAHDRAWVPAKDCFLYSEKDPNNFRTKRQDILDSMQEAEQHIRNISRKYGKFVYPPFKTQFDPSKLNEQLKLMIPSFEGELTSPVKAKPSTASPASMKDKSRSNSKSSKGSHNDGDTSEGEDTVVGPRKMATGAEIAKEEEDVTMEEKEKEKPNEKLMEQTMEIEVPSKERDSNSSRKRRRSDLEEAVITIIDNQTKEKKKRLNSVDKKLEESFCKEVTEVANKEKEKSTSSPEKFEATDNMRVVETRSRSKDNEPPSAEKKEPRVAPIKIISIAKIMKNAEMSAVKDTRIVTKEGGDKQKQKSKDKDKSFSVEKDKRSRRVSSKSSRSSLNDSAITKDKNSEKKGDCSSDISTENPSENKTSDTGKTAAKSTPEKAADKTVAKVISEKTAEKPIAKVTQEKTVAKVSSEKAADKPTAKVSQEKTLAKPTSEKTSDRNVAKVSLEKAADKTTSPRTKDRIVFDDDTSLAIIARETAKSGVTPNTSGLPTISSVRSLSTAVTTDTSNDKNSIDITVEAPSDSSIFTPTSTDNVRNMKEAVDKLQKLRSDTDKPVGRVGVKAFARMTSPEKERPNNDVQVEIKAEPIDLDDGDRQLEKMDLMNAFKLRPVNPPSTNLRDVRINKVAVSPLNNQNVRKPAPKPPVEVRPKAKKTFPQPKKGDEGRSELNSKNSMVYIPIQPPMTQVPARSRPAANGPVTSPASKNASSVNNSPASTQVNTITPPLVPASKSAPCPALTTATSAHSSVVVSVPTVGQVPTTVHTVPLITSVNGQWTFSLQPVMSVGGVDGATSPPMLNGLPERQATILPIQPSPMAPGSCPAVSSAGGPTTLVATGSTAPLRTLNDNNPPREPPRLQQRPGLLNPLDASTPVGSVPPPSSAGPLTAKLNQNAVKMSDFFRTLLEDSIDKLDEPVAQVTSLKLQLEQIRWRHQQELNEVKHNHGLTLAEMRSSFEKEKMRLVGEMRRAAQIELDTAVKMAKSKQWCANCNQEAQFYCCWNTSYCDYPCQRAHWAQHYAVCTQQRSQDGSGGSDSGENRLAPDNLPKTTAAPSLTVGGKLAPSRVYSGSQEQSNVQKPSIIVSMVEDTCGNQTMKCLGTYKPQSSTQVPPLIINKQLMNNEESAKKVVTSGGYLIVGASNSTSSSTPLVTHPAARRNQTMQYLT